MKSILYIENIDMFYPGERGTPSKPSHLDYLNLSWQNVQYIFLVSESWSKINFVHLFLIVLWLLIINFWTTALVHLSVQGFRTYFNHLILIHLKISKYASFLMKTFLRNIHRLELSSTGPGCYSWVQRRRRGTSFLPLDLIRVSYTYTFPWWY